MIVELHQAWSWDCDSCGRENFERALNVDRESLSDEDRFEAEEIFGTDAVLVSAPTSVICRHCSAEFDTDIIH